MLNAILNFIIKECYHERKSQFMTLLHNTFFKLLFVTDINTKMRKKYKIYYRPSLVAYTSWPPFIHQELHGTQLMELNSTQHGTQRQHSNSKIIHNL